MPRPPYKRAKLNHPTPSRRVAKPSNIPPLIELQLKLADKPLGRVLTDSDDSDKLVTSNRTGRNRRGIPRRDIYASGGVGAGDVPGAHSSQGQKPQGSERPGAQKNAGKQRRGAANKPEHAREVAKPPASQPKPVAQVAGKRHLPTQSSPLALGLASVNRAPPRLHTTPGAECSILGNIKPRRRQPSILQQLENDDSSHIGEEDEEDFLPNDESTPLNHSAIQPALSPPNSSLPPQSTSLKRKLSPPTTLDSASKQQRKSSKLENRHHLAATNEENSEPELPPARSVTAPQRATPEPYDPDIMAPPLSSSPLKSPAKPAIASPIKKPPGNGSKRPPAPSTSELRILLPARRQRRGRLRTTPLGEFDIPADSDGGTEPAAASEEDDSSFGVKARSRKSVVATKAKAKPPRKLNPARTEGKDRGGKDKRTLSPTKLVTPLKRSAAAAKSSLTQQQRHQQRPSHGPATTPPKGPKATFSSSSRRHDISADKENRPVTLSGDFYGEDAAAGNLDREQDWLEQSIEEPAVSKMKTEPSKELQQMAQKFAHVDEWEMEFEDVSLGGNSSPNRR